MAGNKDFIDIIREIRGSTRPGQPLKDGIWYELTVADKNGNPGIYGDILAKYGIITESAGTFDQAVAILENLNVEITTLPEGTQATSELVNGVWQIGLPRGVDGTQGIDGNTPEVALAYDSGNLNYTVTVDGAVVTNVNLLNLDALVDSKVSTNVGVQETLEAKQDVLDAVAAAQGLNDSFEANVVTKKQEIVDLTETKKQEIVDEGEVQTEFVRDVGEEVIQEFDEHALHRTNQYDSNHATKLNEYNANDSVKMNQYNENHIERLSEINYAYADRIVEMIRTRNFMGILDEYVAKTATHMITFLDTEDSNYIYYANGTLLTEGLDYTIYDSKTIELIVKANPYDVVVQVNTRVLKEMLTAEGALFEDRLGQPNGVASLNEIGQVPAEQLPSYVDDVIEVETYADLPAEGETDKIYVVVADETSNDDTSTYRWTGAVYAMVSNTLNASDVKALYEANPDTNAYTDAEKMLVDVGQVLETTATTLPTAINEVYNALDAHKMSTGEDHTYIDQDVTTTATPTFAGIITEGLVDGRDVSVDGAKLDTIEEGATADQTAEEILALLKTVDGSGSELDADLLDGQDSTYYLDADNINAGTLDDARLPDTITSDITGNATTATKLQTARTITLTGDVSGDVSFDGSVNVSIETIVADDSHNHVIDNIDGLQDALDNIDTNIANLVDEVALKAYVDNATLTGVPKAPTASVGTNTTQLATTEFVKAEVASETYSKVELDAGQLDNRYYTESEIDAKLEAQNDASEINVTPSGNLESENVQAALEELQNDLDNMYTKINNVEASALAYAIALG